MSEVRTGKFPGPLASLAPRVPCHVPEKLAPPPKPYPLPLLLPPTGDGHPSYAGLIRKVDRMVGQVLQALREGGMVERTVLLVMSDHGREARQGEQ